MKLRTPSWILRPWRYSNSGIPTTSSLSQTMMCYFRPTTGSINLTTSWQDPKFSSGRTTSRENGTCNARQKTDPTGLCLTNAQPASPLLRGKRRNSRFSTDFCRWTSRKTCASTGASFAKSTIAKTACLKMRMLTFLTCPSNQESQRHLSGESCNRS